MIRKLCYRIYHKLQKNYFSLVLISKLQKMQITTLLGDMICYPSIIRNMKNPNQETMRARKFYKENREGVKNVLSMLEDEKSKAVYRNVIAYRTGKALIKRDMYSLWDQYFCKDIIRLQNGEVFIDGGAYVGDTIERLIKEAKKQKVKIQHIVAFEPGNDNYTILRKKFSGGGIPVAMIKKGLSDSEKCLHFLERGSSSGFVSTHNKSDSESVPVPVIDIDSVKECRDATFIKMDIEGAEMDALYGARKTILHNHPKLAVCIYHSDADMIRIAAYIHELVPEYRLYVRHHTRRDHETVLYAVIG